MKFELIQLLILTNMPQISILIPTCNRPRELNQLLSTLDRQTFKDFEVIVVNDGQTSVSELCRRENGLSIKYLTNPYSLGGTSSRNIALSQATGEYIMPIDDDDLILPEHLEILMKHRNEADLLYCDAEIVVEDRNADRKILERLPYAFDFDPEVQKWCLTVIPSGMCYRRELHDKLGLFDENFRNNYWDWDWMLRILPEHRVKRLPYASVLYFFDQSGNNASFDHTQMQPDLVRLSEKHGLGELRTENFLTILQNPKLDYLKRETEILWDGKI